jgi:hypothetical protein
MQGEGMTYRWVAANTVKEIVTLQKSSSSGVVADAVLECVAAYRLFAAIELWFQGKTREAQDAAAKCQLNRFTDLDALLRLQKRLDHREDPFTLTCIAAHQQKADFDKLRASKVDDDQLARIKARHERYRTAQTTPIDP